MTKRKKRKLLVVLLNIVIMAQIDALAILSACGHHVAATLVTAAICLAMFFWTWESPEKFPVFGLGSSLCVFIASLAGLGLCFTWTNVMEAFAVGLTFTILGLINLVFFDCYYSMDRLDWISSLA